MPKKSLTYQFKSGISYHNFMMRLPLCDYNKVRKIAFKKNISMTEVVKIAIQKTYNSKKRLKVA